MEITQNAIRNNLIFSLIISLILIGCGQGGSNESADSGREELKAKIDSIGSSYIQSGKVKGISIAVGNPEGTVYNAGYGHIDSLNTMPVSGEHYFLMASISKLVAATMVMKLVEENKLSLDQTLAELLPDFPNPGQAQSIALRHLLSHTSGLMDYAMDVDPVYLETGRNPDKSDYYQFFETHPLFFEPGEFYSYSNSGFVLLPMIIERVTGKSFSSELNRIINEPTGLNLALIADRINDPKMSPYFELVDSTMVATSHWPWIKGDGGLTATAEELSRFPFFWADGSIISKRSFGLMTQPFVLRNGIETGYGLGVRTGKFEGEKVIGHTGGNKSGFAMMMYLPEQEMSIVVMVNTDNTPADAITIIGPVALAVLNRKVPEPGKIEKENIDLTKYEGTYLLHEYKNSSFDTLQAYIHPEDGHLYMKRSNSSIDGLKYYALGNHSFTYDEYPMDRVIFQMDADGRAVAFSNYWNGMFQRMGFRDALFADQLLKAEK